MTCSGCKGTKKARTIQYNLIKPFAAMRVYIIYTT